MRTGELILALGCFVILGSGCCTESEFETYEFSDEEFTVYYYQCPATVSNHTEVHMDRWLLIIPWDKTLITARDIDSISLAPVNDSVLRAYLWIHQDFRPLLIDSVDIMFKPSGETIWWDEPI